MALSPRSGKIDENGREDALIVETLRGALPDVAAAYRFGSTATGQAGKESDVDIAVLPAAPLDPVFRFDLQETLAVALHRPVDLVDLLQGRLTIGRLDSQWAAIRLLEYAPYEEIVRLLGFRNLVEGWPRWRGRIRSASRRRGFDFLAEWLPRRHPELLR